MYTIYHFPMVCFLLCCREHIFQYGFGYVWITQEIADVNICIKMFKQRLKKCYT